MFLQHQKKNLTFLIPLKNCSWHTMLHEFQMYNRQVSILCCAHCQCNCRLSHTTLLQHHWPYSSCRAFHLHIYSTTKSPYPPPPFTHFAHPLPAFPSDSHQFSVSMGLFLLCFLLSFSVYIEVKPYGICSSFSDLFHLCPHTL